MKHIQQPEKTQLCGQCVVAMLTGRTLADVIAVMGSGRTYPPALRKHAKALGIAIEKNSQDGSVVAPMGRGAAMIWGERQHWVAWDEGAWFDPAAQHLLTDLTHYQAQRIALYRVIES